MGSVKYQNTLPAILGERFLFGVNPGKLRGVQAFLDDKEAKEPFIKGKFV